MVATKKRKANQVQPVPRASEVREALDAFERGLKHLRGLAAALERVEGAVAGSAEPVESATAGASEVVGS